MKPLTDFRKERRQITRACSFLLAVSDQGVDVLNSVEIAPRELLPHVDAVIPAGGLGCGSGINRLAGSGKVRYAQSKVILYDETNISS